MHTVHRHASPSPAPSSPGFYDYLSTSHRDHPSAQVLLASRDVVYEEPEGPHKEKDHRHP